MVLSGEEATVFKFASKAKSICRVIANCIEL